MVFCLTQDHCHMLYISTVESSLATLAPYVVFCLTQDHCHMLYISTVESSLATLAPYVVFCLTQDHCHMLYISISLQYLLATHAHTIVLLTSLVSLYIVFSRLSVNHTTSNVPPPHHLLLLLLHTIQLAITFPEFFPVYATLYICLYFWC